MDAAINALNASILAIAQNAAANGAAYNNTAQPATTHVPDRARWVLTQANEFANITTQIAYAAGVNVDAAARAALPGLTTIQTAVIMAVARTAFVRMTGINTGQLNPVETYQTAPLAIHADHMAEVTAAIGDYGGAAPRYFALAYYNAISLATTNHHHLSESTTALVVTTKTLTYLSAYLQATPGAESHIFHDMFHPLSYAVKSELARSVPAKPALEGAGFSNLARRIPVKAADTAIALNYGVLHAKAIDYMPSGGGVPATLAPPAALAAHIQTYIAAVAAQAPAAVAQLVADSTHLGQAAAFLAGYLLGKIRRHQTDPELTLKAASKMMSILGSPALKRLSEEHPGTFAEGAAAGYAVPAVDDQAGHLAQVIAGASAGVALVV